MSINGLNTNYNGIDVQNVNKVTANILASLENKTVDVSKVDLTRFNRASQGVDLYSNKTSLDVQRQIAMQNAGLFNTQMNLQAVQALNASAAAQLYSPEAVTKNVEGKMTINANAEMETFQQLAEVKPALNVFETDKDKKGSNPFSFNQSAKQNEEKEQPLNFFA